MKRILPLVVLMGLSSVAGAQPAAPMNILPKPLAMSLLNADPRVASARSTMDAAMLEAGIIRKSPYEWNATATGQQRRVDAGPNYNEWNVGIQRTIRLPGKGRADQDISGATVKLADATYGEVRHETARELMTMWLDWLASEHALEIANKGLASAKESLAAVEKRNRAGDASKLDVSLVKAEIADQLRQGNEAKVKAAASWATLSRRFPGIDRKVVALPVPSSELGQYETWRERILAESDVLRRVEASLLRSEGQSARAKADKIPDPTLGVFTASEQGARERIYGVTFSMPIPSGTRSARYSQAMAQESAARQDVDLIKRELEAAIARDVEMASGAYENFRIATEGAEAMAQNEAQMQRAYELGEADLQSLLLSRRQAVTSASNALQAHVDTLRTHLSLLIDAHWIWGLDES
ncbi:MULTISPECIES: TolC family protein [Pseudomonas putida group]|jgi:outer membrane protein TolC|uniref:TolC family protein n=1 Tax=Pseudomonas putida TaxID=303 RepID=A0ABD7B5D6_PSEPU|nr:MULTISPECIES: TolC family protein [Pseudomonas putida group]MCL8302837.1 TolC family protein [Pseudomonas mosselii]MCL8340834.1 TolC family protein [Pseudomonas mosselii]QOC95520.1 TolC family protein [Pseudomonas putida]WJR25895.1 TolC family protein [Pseudomonas mosselii]